MKTYKELSEALWPGTPEYKKKFPNTERTTGTGARHDIKATKGGVVATRRFGGGDEAEAPKVGADGNAPVKRGRGRPPGKYGSYKKRVKESLDIIDTLETEQEIVQFINSLDEETFAELAEFVAEQAEQDQQ